MGEEFYIGVPDDDLPQCPHCKQRMVWVHNTLVCLNMKCEAKDLTLAELNWQMELMKKEKEKV
jgi:hypothetical protein